MRVKKETKIAQSGYRILFLQLNNIVLGIVWSYAVALAVSLLLEAPLLQLTNLFFKSSTKTRKYEKANYVNSFNNNNNDVKEKCT